MAAVAAATFISTSLDNLFLLMGLVGGSGLRRRDIALGYGASVAVVLAAGVAGNLIADLAAPGWLRFLGAVPLAMGLWRVRALRRTPAPAAADEAVRGGTGIATIFGVMLAASGDSLVVFTSLMAETADAMVLVIIVTALSMSVGWSALARWVVEHPALAPFLHRCERWIVPPLLVAIGLYILLDTSTDTM